MRIKHLKGSSDSFCHYWVFQFNPDIYNWFGWIRENRVSEQWLVSRFAKLICVGDKVAIWASGKESGIYALGETITYPLKTPLNLEQAEYYRAKEDVDKFKEKPSVSIKYLKVFAENPISKDKCKKDIVLSSLEILNNFTNATNFKLKKTQWNKMSEMVE
jgi:hypothetical protein